jgi:hypothetical protein
MTFGTVGQIHLQSGLSIDSKWPLHAPVGQAADKVNILVVVILVILVQIP